MIHIWASHQCCICSLNLIFFTGIKILILKLNKLLLAVFNIFIFIIFSWCYFSGNKRAFYDNKSELIGLKNIHFKYKIWFCMFCAPRGKVEVKYVKTCWLEVQYVKTCWVEVQYVKTCWLEVQYVKSRWLGFSME